MSKKNKDKERRGQENKDSTVWEENRRKEKQKKKMRIKTKGKERRQNEMN